MNDLLMPYINARRDGDGDDLISRLWHDGPGLMDDWGIEDVYIHLVTLFIGGWDTTTLALSSSCTSSYPRIIALTSSLS